MSKPIEVIAIVVMVALVFSVTTALIGGYETQTSSQSVKMPKNATSIIDKGNGWTVFELDGNRFLYHQSSRHARGFEAITVIPNE